MTDALYNENDPFAAQWLANLIECGLIAPGRVETRSITELEPADVAGPGQRHFFAGIGGWSYACRLAGVPDDADVWTGSCPCQPFSDAGKRSGVRDARHLWPAWFSLIRECRPAVIYGEQVASRAGLAWLDLVFADLEGCGYAVGAADLCAASVGAPHIRQRLGFVAVSGGQRREGQRLHVRERRSRAHLHEVGWAARLALVDSGRDGTQQHAGELHGDEAQREVGTAHGDHAPLAAGAAGELGNSALDELARPAGCGGVAGAEAKGTPRLPSDHRAEHAGAAGPACWRHGAQPADYCADCCELANRIEPRRPRPEEGQERGGLGGARTDGALDPWRDLEWLRCADGVSRPTQPGLFPLAHGLSGRMAVRRTVGEAESEVQEEHWYNRVGAIVGFGNAIVPQLWAVFIRCAEEARREVTP